MDVIPPAIINRAGISVASVILFSTAAYAQKVPTDLLDLSIEELFDANVVTDSERTISDNRWHVSYTYAVSDYDEYYIGSNSVSYDDVLFSPGLEPRTQNNYPVVPTEIKQEQTFRRRTPPIAATQTQKYCRRINWVDR